ncbi:MAG: histidine--tRNA ligase [Patescibacteria group bacterium]|nr:histidine--tRNA ligase [Patescibacteria group bacterium]
MLKFQTPNGMHDLLSDDLTEFEKAKKTAAKIADFYGFEMIETPIMEFSALFEKGTGLSTDIVEKEMYTLQTKGGDSLTLRPEYTPGIARAYIQHGMQALPKPVRLWYFGPVFRHERPQAGRLRQFYQLGFESLGVKEPVVDAVIILMAFQFLKSLGFRNLAIDINTIGDAQCRPAFRRSLLGYYRNKQGSLCPDCKRRLKKNPLRILDCKDERCSRFKKNAPQILDFLCKECHNYFKELLEFLDELELPYNLNSNLVRGLDYYTKTVFEIYEDTEEGRVQGSLAGGGRYDDLVRLLGGKDTPACGVALGIDRLLNLQKGGKEENEVKEKEEKADVFLAQVGDLARKKGLKLFSDLRGSGVKIGEALHKDSLSGQLKIAEKLQADYILIIGQKEALSGEVIVRDSKTSNQKILPLDKALEEVKKKIKNN